MYPFSCEMDWVMDGQTGFIGIARIGFLGFIWAEWSILKPG